MEVPLITAEQPSDYYLDYTRKETMRALEPYVKQALAAGHLPEITSAAGARFFLRNIDTSDLLKMKRNQGVLQELLLRQGVREELRRQALLELARTTGQAEAKTLVTTLRERDNPEGNPGESVVIELTRLLTDRNGAELSNVRGDLERLAITAQLPVIRQFGFAALIATDGSANQAWTLASSTALGLRDLLGAMPLIRDPDLRASLYARVEPLLKKSASANKARNIQGRYVRIELPSEGTLTLAEVEVYSEGHNVARQGKASQKDTSVGGVASRAIDGNSSGRWEDGGQTHTQEKTENPWWEVDLRAEYPIDSIVIYNRTESLFGKRLNGFNLIILDTGRNVVYKKAGNPAPEVKATFELGGDQPEAIVRARR